MRYPLALIPAALLLASCGAAPEPTPAPTQVTMETPAPPVMDPPATGTPDPDLIEADEKLNDMIGNVPMDMSDIHPDVLSEYGLKAEEYTPKGALMCPESGGGCVYGQVLGQALEADIMRSLAEAEAELDAM